MQLSALITKLELSRTIKKNTVPKEGVGELKRIPYPKKLDEEEKF